jgi:hypothetical protein
MSIARLTFPPRLELKSLAGSFKKAPLAKVTFATNLYVSPVQMMPSCDQTGMVEQYSLYPPAKLCLLLVASVLKRGGP